MKRFGIILFAVLVCLILLAQHCLTFIYVVPQTNTESLKYISNVMKKLDSSFKKIEKLSKKEGLPIKYLYINAYGSGFIPKNEIPNDLDVAFGVDFGEYDYNGDNADEIADSIAEKILFMETQMNLVFKMDYYPDIVTKESTMRLVTNLNKQKIKNVNNIKDSIDTALKEENYVKYTVKNISENKENLILIDVPYVMKAHEILYEDLKPTVLYSDLVVYNPDMPRYMREISIIPEMTVRIKHNGKSTLITLVSESFLGERLQLERRFYASNVFLHNSKSKIVENFSCLKDDDKYIYYRMLSFKRHLHVINNIIVMEDKPIKLLKRIIQAADMVEPILTNEQYKEISDFVYTNLNNKDIQDLNEYFNVIGLLVDYLEFPELYVELKYAGKLDVMFDVLEDRTNALEARGNIDKNTIKQLRKFYQEDLKDYKKLNTPKEIEKYLDYIIYHSSYEELKKEIDKCAYKIIANKGEIEKILGIFNEVYYSSGYHKVTLYWLKPDLIGVLKDDFTENIKDLNQFAKDNDLTGVNYELVDKSAVDSLLMNARYDVWGRYNPTAEEVEIYDDMIRKLLEDKKNFNVKRQTVWVN